MNAVDIDEFRSRVDFYLNQITEEHPELLLRRRGKPNLVFILGNTYTPSDETNYLLAEPNGQKLLKSIGQFRNGQTESHDLLEE